MSPKIKALLTILRFLIQTNIFISLAATAFTVEAQILLGFDPEWRPYLFIIFFATFFEYNIHRLITVLFRPAALEDPKHHWVKKHKTGFYILCVISLIGFVYAISFARKEVLIALAPLALITLFYSIPVFQLNKILFRLREIPFLKIFLISGVWAGATILLPVIEKGLDFLNGNVVLVFIERFLFVFAITIPFDIRDRESDLKIRLKTIPVILGNKRSLRLASALTLAFMMMTTIHHFYTGQFFIIPAMLISGLSTFYFLNSEKLRRLKYYHYGVLDGTMILQALLVIGFYWLWG